MGDPSEGSQENEGLLQNSVPNARIWRINQLKSSLQNPDPDLCFGEGPQRRRN